MENTAKNFALQLGSLITLYISVGSLIALTFAIITVLYPDIEQNNWEQSSAALTIRNCIAFLVVFFPTYVVLTRYVNKIRRTESGVYLTLTKWLVYISLLIGGGVLLGDLVAVLTSFLNGELTTRFILKALSVFVVTGLASTYYLLDARSYWHTHEKRSIQFGALASVLVLGAIVFGFMHTDSPKVVREKNIDTTTVAALTNIQERIQTYISVKGTLPDTIEEAFVGLTQPEAAKGRAPYTYTKTSDTSFKLCAEFAYVGDENQYSSYGIDMSQPLQIKNPYDWNHAAGKWCFERAIVALKATDIPQKLDI
jgi:hypothetical protein